MNAHATRIIEGGKVVIPARLRREVGFKTGDTVVMDVV